MMKKWSTLFVFSILLSTKVWGAILELDDLEKLNKSYSRIFNNILDFYQANSAQIKILKEQGFFQSKSKNAAICIPALEEIKSNQNSLIAQDYGVKPSGFKKLKRDLVQIENHLSSEADQQTQTIVRFAKGILVILHYFGA